MLRDFGIDKGFSWRLTGLDRRWQKLTVIFASYRKRQDPCVAPRLVVAPRDSSRGVGKVGSWVGPEVAKA